MKKKKENIIRIIDVTNRDGVQTSRLGLAKLEKTMINMYLNDMGVYQSEFGYVRRVLGEAGRSGLRG